MAHQIDLFCNFSVSITGLRLELPTDYCDVHRSFCLSPSLFFMVLEALSQEFCTVCPWKIDLIIITESLEELQRKLILWKTNIHIEGKGLWANMGKNRGPDVCARA